MNSLRFYLSHNFYVLNMLYEIVIFQRCFEVFAIAWILVTF